MLSLFQRQPFIGILAIACAVLAIAIGLETGFGARFGPSIPSGTAKPAAPFEAKLLPPVAPVNAEHEYPEMVARPLFAPLRRPAPAAEAAPQSAMKRGQYTLQGVTIAGETKIALLKEKSTGRIYRVEKGHDFNGLKLADVSPESATLAQGGEQEVLPLQVIKPAPLAHVPGSGPFGPAPGVRPGNPAARPGAVNPAVNPAAHSAPRPAVQNPPPTPLPQATTAPLTPEELLARRRARRAEQNQ
jgi:hypothetical protein